MVKTSVSKGKNGQYKTTIPKAIGDGFDLDGVKLEWSAESASRLVATIVDEDDPELATDGGTEDGDRERCPSCGFEQTERCVITDDGVAYACESPECRVSTFLGERYLNTEKDREDLRTDGGSSDDAVRYQCDTCLRTFKANDDAEFCPYCARWGIHRRDTEDTEKDREDLRTDGGSSDDRVRGDPMNPVAQMQAELYDVLSRYADVRKAAPAYVCALLVDIADSIRILDDVGDVDVKAAGGGVYIIRFSDRDVAFVGAPRSGDYLDVDVDELDERADVDLEDGGISSEWIELADVEDLEDEGGWS